jgi:hypothetical protein
MSQVGKGSSPHMCSLPGLPTTAAAVSMRQLWVPAVIFRRFMGQKGNSCFCF